jgi:hypothetical protein
MYIHYRYWFRGGLGVVGLWFSLGFMRIAFTARRGTDCTSPCLVWYLASPFSLVFSLSFRLGSRLRLGFTVQKFRYITSNRRFRLFRKSYDDCR